MTGQNNMTKYSSHKPKYRVLIELLRDVTQDVFSVSISLLLIFVLLETIKEGFISYFFNINNLIAIVVVSGVITVLAGEEKAEEEPQGQKLALKQSAIVLGLGVLGTVLVWYQTARAGELAYLLAITSGVLIVLLSVLLLTASNRR